MDLLVLARPDDDLTELLPVLEARAEVTLARTSTADSLAEALTAAPSVVVVAGGDGTMHAVISALHDLDRLASTTVGLVPLGTGNDFARGVGIPLDPAEAAAVVLAGRTCPMDVLLDDVGGLVVNSVHAGAGADAAKRGEWWKKHLGKIGYPIGALLTALSPPTLRLSVDVDERAMYSGGADVLQVAIGNGPQVGGGTSLVPTADPSDGLIDVIVSTPVGLLRHLGYARDLVLGRHHRRADVAHQRGRSVRVSGEEFWCSTDGEIEGPMRRRTWTVSPSAYRLLVP
ncbi:diacylglycerol/lipid kinase family protein [Nocardioides sp. Kera G14]|uniref:diacylglycerol/lipid kinase family protein n=1 Tax=Nocardioides sp. Kera G14 TaxID=2884264 RepID=UPI001D12C5DA|nr:YegS/Rv2252/BmrU family lipid kinase [Nocardioides sp. Kera G14]UDY24578.1 YegS/Rv2252/BmrU family lipid kinase [Nocardioides sp. Kera G14]